MINCTRTPEQIQVLRKKIAKDLLVIINDPAKTFNLNNYLKSIYDRVLAKSGNKNLAVEYAMLTAAVLPEMIAQPKSKEIRKKGLSLDEVFDLRDELSNPEKGLDNTVAYLGLNEPPKDLGEIISEINFEEQRTLVSAQISKAGVPFTRPRPINPFATTINTLSDPGNASLGEDAALAYYTDFIKFLAAKGLTPKPGETGIEYPGVTGGIHISLVPIKRIPEGQIYPQPANKNPYAFVITDVNGTPLYFNEQFNVSDKGRIIYYGSRPIPGKLDNGKYNWQKNEYTQSPKEISDNSEGEISIEQAEALLTAQFDALSKSYAYLNQNPGNTIVYSITDARLGIYTDAKGVSIKVSQANFGNVPLKLDFVTKDKKQSIQLKVGASNMSVQVFTKPADKTDIDKLVKLLTTDVYKNVEGKRVKVSLKEKYELINSFFGGQERKGLKIDFDYKLSELYITHNGKDIDLNDSSAVQKLTDALSFQELRNAISSDKKKFPREYSILTKNFNENSFTNFNLSEQDGTIVLDYFTENQIEYLDRVSKEIRGFFDSNGKLREYNGYFTISPVKAEVGKTVLKNPVTVQQPQAPVSTAPVVSNPVNEAAAQEAVTKAKARQPRGRSSADSNVIGNAIKNGKLEETIRKAKGLNKLDKQQSVKATVAQIYAAKAWYERSPLAKVIPYEVMFNAVNSNTRGSVATWTLSGITLFQGSDFTDLYHEAWHGFTQTFMTEAQRNEMYAEARKSTGTFMSYMGRTVSFADATLLELEEYLAEDFREFMLGKGKPVEGKPVRNKFFQWLLDLLKNLFGGTTVDEVQLSPRDNKVIGELYEKLRVGNLTGYTFDQANANFDVLNKTKTIESTAADSPYVMNSMISKLLGDSTDALFSEYVDKVNEAYNTAAATTTLIKDKQSLSVGYDYVREQMTAQLEYLLEERSKMDSNIEDTSDTDFAIDTIAAGLANFGDPYNLDNPVGLVKFHMENSTLMKSTIQAIEEEASITDRNVFEKRAGNEVPLANLAKPDVLFTIRSLKAYEKDGSVKLNILGLPDLNDFKKSWNRILNITEGANTDNEVYEKLKLAAEDYPIIKELMSKIGSPQNLDEASVNLWTDFTKILTMPRINLRMLELKQTDRFIQDVQGGFGRKETSYIVSPVEATGEFRKVGRRWNDNFAIADEGEYITKDIYGNNILNVNAVYRQFRNTKFTKDNIDDIYKFFDSIGIVLEDGKSAKADAYKSGLANYGKRTMDYLQAIYAYNKSKDGLLNPIKIQAPSDIYKNYKSDSAYKLPKKIEQVSVRQVLGGGSGIYNGLQKFQLKWSDDFADTTVNNANNQSQQERSLRSTISNQIGKWNRAKSITELTQEGVPNANDLSMSHLSPSRNPFVKSTIIYKSTFDENGVRRTYKDSSSGQQVPVSIQLNNMAGFMNQYTNTRNIMERSGIDASSADETTKLVGDFLMLTLYGATEATRHADKATTLLYKLLNGKLHYIDLKNFKTAGGKTEFADTLIGYLSSEFERIQKLKNGDPSATVTVGDKTYGEVAQDFVIFNGILKPETITNLKEQLATSPEVQTSEQFLKFVDGNLDLKNLLQTDITDYLTEQRQKNAKMLQESGILSNTGVINSLLEKLETGDSERSPKDVINGLTAERREKMITALIDGYTANDWIHKYEFSVMFYGDPALYKNVDDFFKRNAGIAATGDFARTGPAMTAYIDSKFAQVSYAATRGKTRASFGNTMNSAVMQDVVSKSIYYDTYLEAALKIEKDRLKKVNASPETVAKAEASIKKVFSKYTEMTEADGQGWISFDAYRALLMSLNKWTPNQEFLYNKIVKGEEVAMDDVLNFFPVKKMQYWGPLMGTGLPATAFHKYSLMPLIPSVIKNTPLENLHNKMVDQDIDYALMQSGSKVSTITKDGKADKFYNDNQRTTEGYAFDAPTYQFTKNTVFLDYFKDQLEVAEYYKKKVTFSSQLRKLIEQGLFENKVPVDYKPNIADKNERYRLWNAENDKLSTKFARYASRFEKILDSLVEIEKQKIRDQVGSTKKSLIEFIKSELSGPGKKLSEHEVDFLGVDEATDTLLRDLDLSPSADVIERALVNIAQKRILNQKLTGESLVQVSGVGFEQGRLRTATEEEIGRYGGTNGLPFYNPKLDKKGNVISVSAMKIKISLQGPFKNLLNHADVVKYSNENGVTRLDALNHLIKQEWWLNQGDNRAMVTTAAVRIPVQGLNSMEVMEVFEFLPEESGNIVILPAEIVAKSGGDFDIDKMFTFFPTIKTKREVNEEDYALISDILGFGIDAAIVNEIKELVQLGEDLDISTLTEEEKDILRAIDTYYEDKTSAVMNFGDDKAGLENQLLGVIKDILLDPFNFSSLITPNTTDTMEPLGETIAKETKGAGTQKAKGLSEIFEVGRNLYKHQSNNVGKDVLGIIAVVNTFQSIFGRSGLVLTKNRIITQTQRGSVEHPQRLKFAHNKIGDSITLSANYDAEQLNKISDIISQLINGSVDVAKKAWIFDVQGNKELINSLLFMTMAGVPVEDAVYFLSQPIIRDFVKEQRKFKSQYSRAIGYGDVGNFFRNEARDRILFADKGDNKYGFNWLVADFQEKSDKDSTSKYKNKKPSKRLVFEEIDRLVEGIGEFKKADLAGRLNKSNDFDNYDRSVFLHFLEISEMSSQITQLTQNLNFDRTKTETLLDARLRLAKIDDLANGIEPESIQNIIENSPVSAYKIQDFILDLFSDLFPLRDSKEVNRKIASLTDKDISGMPPISAYKKMTGLDADEYIERFRSDLINYVFQSNYYRFNQTQGVYRGFEVQVPIEGVTYLRAGARVKNGILYASKSDILTTFQQELYSKDSMWENEVAPVESSVFALYDAKTAEALYTKFVYEREVLRSFEKNSPENLKNSSIYKTHLNTFKNDSKPAFKAYEATLRDMALDNLNYHGHMFFGGRSYAKQVLEIGKENPSLLDKYEVLDRLEISTGGSSFVTNDGKKQEVTINNLKFTGDRPTPEELDLYTQQIEELADPNVIKVEDPIENERISKVFARFGLYALLQTGIDTTSAFSLIRAVPNDMFYGLLKSSYDKFLTDLKARPNTVLDEYTSLFNNQYRIDNKNVSNKLKNYAFNPEGIPSDIVRITDDTVSELETPLETEEETPGRIVTINGINLNLDKLDIPFTPNDQQLEALQQIADFIDNPNQDVFTLMGYAGTGKSSITKIALEYMRQRGLSINVTAPTHKAKKVIAKLAKTGAVTLQKLLGLGSSSKLTKTDLRKIKLTVQKESLYKPDVVIVDEASLVGDELFDALSDYAGEGKTKILFIGDPAQLNPVEEDKTTSKRSKAFDHPYKYELTKVERQAGSNPLGPILEDIRNNQKKDTSAIDAKTELSGNQGIVTTKTGVDFTRQAIAAFKSENFKNNRNFVRILSHSNERVEDFNQVVRNKIWFDKEVDTSKILEYVIGDIIMAYENVGYKKGGTFQINNSVDYEVLSVQAENKMTFNGLGGLELTGYTIQLQEIDGDGDIYEKFVLSRSTSQEIINLLAQKLVEYQKSLDAQVESGELRANQAFAIYSGLKDSIMTPFDVTDKKGRVVLKKSIDYGYAHTIHKSQGSTYTNVFVDTESIIEAPVSLEEKNQLKYVALSRATNIAYALNRNGQSGGQNIEWNGDFGSKKVVAGKISKSTNKKRVGDIQTLTLFELLQDTSTGVLTFNLLTSTDEKTKKVVNQFDKLTDQNAIQLSVDYPNTIFVRNEASTQSRDTAGTNVVYRAMGDNSLGIRTKSLPRVSQAKEGKIKDFNAKAAWTDATLKENKAMIDEDIAALMEKKESGVNLAFDSNGYGQYLIGYNEYFPAAADAQYADKTTIGVQTFLYLSQQLFEKFGYINPHYLTFGEGRIVVQYGAPVTDEEIAEFNNKCFK
jgi:exodeoxyribonuclease-5